MVKFFRIVIANVHSRDRGRRRRDRSNSDTSDHSGSGEKSDETVLTEEGKEIEKARNLILDECAEDPGVV